MTSGRSTLNGRLARLDRRNEGLSQRDFSGTSGEIGYIWTVDGRLLYTFSLSRNLLPWTADTQASFRVDDRFSFSPSLQISERVAIRLAVYRIVSDFRGAIAPLTGPPRRDITRSAQLAIDWSPPTRNNNLRFTGSVQRDRRSSNAAGLDFDDTIAMLTAALTF
jgi:hypothetical protein